MPLNLLYFCQHSCLFQLHHKKCSGFSLYLILDSFPEFFSFTFFYFWNKHEMLLSRKGKTEERTSCLYNYKFHNAKQTITSPSPAPVFFSLLVCPSPLPAAIFTAGFGRAAFQRRNDRFRWRKPTIISSNCCWSETAESERHVCCSDSARTPSTPPSYLQ